jgi:hypothetical protein
MEATKIHQFTGADSVEITGASVQDIGPLVSIIQSSGSMRFQFSMTPAQAREMAVALERHADALEQAE